MVSGGSELLPLKGGGGGAEKVLAMLNRWHNRFLSLKFQPY